jgi:GT2 family glycosyltransferase
MKVAVIVASTGRPVELARWVEHCARQSQAPVEVILSIASPADLPPNFDSQQARVHIGPKGSAHQRNTGLKHLRSDAEIVAFFDDDYVPSRHCIKGISAAFSADSSIVAASGTLLADGINSPGIDYNTAMALLNRFDISNAALDVSSTPAMGTYGCNMAFRRKDIGDIRFDERLPLYAWQEDVDFSRRLRGRGRIVVSKAFVGVHQGVKIGRTPGLRFGYSQIANPLYLIRKGTMPVPAALWLMARNVLSNHIRTLRPEPWVDRTGRMAGNWRALGDLVRGRLQPERILSL